MLINNTPVQRFEIDGRPILVKREDLCCPYPGPSFSKMRGVVAHIRNRPESGIGVLDTYHSKAGWAVSWACRHLGKQAVNFWPRYKKDGNTPFPRRQQREAFDLGANMVELQAGRSAILYHRARKFLRENHSDAYLMPNALKLPESVVENGLEAQRTFDDGKLPRSGTLILSISSGTVAAGVISGALASGSAFEDWRVILHMGYSRSQPATRAYMEKAAGLDLSDAERFRFVDEGYAYSDRAPGSAAIPFPCNPYYDAKAWAWLASGGIREVPAGPILFWNIGD